MSTDINKWDELLKQTTAGYKIDNTEQDIAHFKKKLVRFSFLRFSFYTFNIFYASVAFGMITIGSFTGYKYVYVPNFKHKTPSHNLINVADTTLKNDTLIIPVEPEPMVILPEKIHIPEKQNLAPQLKNEPVSKPDTTKTDKLVPDTLIMTIQDTIYKKVKVVVRDTVKIKRKKPKLQK